MLSIISHIIGTLVFFGTIVICFLIARNRYTSGNDEEQRFWSRESESNSVRRKDISGLSYIHVPVDSLPMDLLLSSGSKRTYDTLISLSGKNILNLSAYTNTDLKMMYGPANLGELSQCDENYTLLIRTLQKAGATLAGSDDEPGTPKAVAAAISFLEYSVSIGSDISGTYELLGTIYRSAGDRSAFENLFEYADKLNSISKPVILSKLNSIKSSWK